jgi:hypothetical protein
MAFGSYRKRKPSDTPDTRPTTVRPADPLEVPSEPDPSVAGGESASWTQVRADAAKLGPGLSGALRWISRRCEAINEHPLADVMLENLDAFFRTDKLQLVMIAGLRAGKTSSILRALVASTLWPDHTQGKSEFLVVPVMSARREYANDNFRLLRRILRACGIADARSEDEGPAMLEGGIGGTYTYKLLASGGGEIEVKNEFGATIVFRCLPVLVNAVVSYTSCGGFFDEVDLWLDGDKRVNPAAQILIGARERTTTIPTARLFVCSAHYPEQARFNGAMSAFMRAVYQGDTSLQYVAKLGIVGAARSDRMRRQLANMIRSQDERLITPADPMASAIPAWVCNPLAPIERCYAMAGENLDQLFAKYGGRWAGGSNLAANFDGLAEANLRLQQSGASSMPTLDGQPAWRAGSSVEVGRCYDGPSCDPRSFSYSGRRGVL